MCLFLINPILLLVDWFYLSVFNAPRAKPYTGLTTEHARRQQRWVWEAAARRQQPGQGAEAVAGEPDVPPPLPQLFRVDEDGELHLLPRPDEGWAHTTKVLKAFDDKRELERERDRLTALQQDELPQLQLGMHDDLAFFLGHSQATADPQSHAESDDPGVDMSACHDVREVRVFVGGTAAAGEVDPAPEGEHEGGGGGGDEAGLPDPNDSVALDAFIKMTTARECLAVVARRAELTRALEYVETKNDARRVQKLRAILSAFDRRWGFAPPRCASYYLLGSTESEDERLEARCRITSGADDDIAQKQG